MPNRYSHKSPARLLVLLSAVALLLAACSDDGGDGGGGGDGDGALAGASITVGSKEFTEQLILGWITVEALRAAGAEVPELVSITGTQNVRTALVEGEIDLYWEYTGTGWVNHLQHETSEAPKGSEELYQAVSEEDLETNNIKWLAPSAVNNTYAIATKTATQEELGVENLSDYAALVQEDPAQGTLCAAEEFLGRDDGWPGVENAYGFDLPNGEIVTLELGIIYTQIGDSCEFGEVFATDGRIVANDLVVLEDDQEFFVKYNVAPTMRQEVFEENPAIEEVLTPIIEALTNDVMLDLNARVDVDGELPQDVATAFLEENSLLPS